MPSSIAERVPYPFASADSMLDILVDNILLSVHIHAKRHDDREMMEKAGSAYRARFGIDITDLGDDYAPTPICMHGLPGNGKTSVSKAAAKEVADALGMELVINPAPGEKIDTKKHFVFVVLDLAGETSNMTLGGLPVNRKLTTADGETAGEYMDKLSTYKLAALKSAAAGFLLMDDFGSANAGIQSAALSLVDEGRYQELDIGNTARILTTNLGAMDGNYVSPLKTAMVSRLSHFYVEDDFRDFARRVRQKFGDHTGDAGVLSFLGAHPHLFQTDYTSDKAKPVNGMNPPSQNPRVWERTIKEMRKLMLRAQAPGAAHKLTYEAINLNISKMVGKSVSQQLIGHFVAILENVDGVARRIAERGLSKEDADEIKRRYGKGLSAEEQTFGMQFIAQLAAHASAHIKDEPDTMLASVKHFTEGGAAVGGEIFLKGLAEFRERILLNVPALGDPSSPRGAPQFTGDAARSVFDAICEALKSKKMASKTLLEDVAAIISGTAALESRMDIEAPRSAA